MDILLGFPHQKLPRPAFVIDDHRHHVPHLLHQLLLGPAEGGLVGDLVEVAHCLRALAIQAAHRQRDLVQAAKHLVDLPGDHQARQMEHDAHPDASADVGRAGREVAKAGVEGVGDDSFDLVVHHLDLLPGPEQIEPAVHALDAQVVFLVDHQADLLHHIDRNAAGALRLGMLAADELPLHQKLAVDLLQVPHVDVLKRPAHGNCGDPVAEHLLHFQAILLRGAAHKRIVGHIAGQPHPAAHHDV